MAEQADEPRDGWLTARDFRLVSAEHVREAVEELRNGATHCFAASIHYDVVLGDGMRLPPKAVFGVAASHALGREVRPRDFRGGDKTPCFRKVEAAGFTIESKKAGGKSERGGRRGKGKAGGASGVGGSGGGGPISPTHANLEDVRATAPLTRWLVEAARSRGTLTYGCAKARLESECGFGEIFPILVGRAVGAAMDRMLFPA